MANPANISVQILEFLKITDRMIFVPRQTRTVQFEEDVIAYILHETAEERQYFGYGVDTYSDIRRTGYPKVFLPNEDNNEYTVQTRDYPLLLPTPE